MTSLKVSSPAELISAVPFLIGFHPSDSLVVVAMHGTRITFAVRSDLPERHTPEVEAQAAVLHLASVVVQQEVEAVTIIGYGEASRVTPAVLGLADVFRRAGVAIVDELRVTEGRYWSYLCTDMSCCSVEGRPCEPAFSIVAAEATFAGAVALPDREALSAQLAPVTGDDRQAMTGATARAILRLAAFAGEHPPPFDAATGRPGGDSPKSGCPAPAELRLGTVMSALGIATPDPEEIAPAAPPPDEPGPATGSSDLIPDEDHFFTLVRCAGRQAVREAEQCYRSGGRLTDDAAAWLGVLLMHPPIRDYAWIRTGTTEWELALWSDLTRRVESRYVPAPAGLLAFVAWRMGLGPLASVAVERARQEKPDYSLAEVVHGAIMLGLPPSVLDGWPAVPGMAPVDPTDLDEDPRPEEQRPERPRPVESRPAASRISDARQGEPISPRKVRLPERRPHGAGLAEPSTAPQGPAGDKPDRRDKRQPKSRRATRRRV